MRTRKARVGIWWASSLLVVSVLGSSRAEDTDGDNAAAMARMLQDPLANISAIMTDNDIHIGTGTGEATTVLQLQPVHSVNFERFSLVPRGVIPIIGLAPGANIPPINQPTTDDGTQWGLGDTVGQLFYTPRTDAAWKFGVGPQISFKTHTDDRLAGSGWGAGVAAVVVGGLGEATSVAVLGGHLWGEEGFSTTLVQPMFFYNFKSVPGLAVGYNGAITYDWNNKAGNNLQLPLGGVVSRTSDLGGGYGLDLVLGAYVYPVKPDGGPDWSFKFGITLLLPRK